MSVQWLLFSTRTQICRQSNKIWCNLWCVKNTNIDGTISRGYNGSVGALQMHLLYSRVEFYRSICSTPLWSSTESKISQYVYYRSICSTPLWSSTESKISQYVSICTAPRWSSIQYQTITKQLISVKVQHCSPKLQL